MFPLAENKVSGPEWSECARGGAAVKTTKGDALLFYRWGHAQGFALGYFIRVWAPLGVGLGFCYAGTGMQDLAGGVSSTGVGMQGLALGFVLLPGLVMQGFAWGRVLDGSPCTIGARSCVLLVWACRDVLCRERVSS